MKAELITKYNVQGPRYTSFPTVPNWNLDNFSLESWKKSVQFQFEKTNQTHGISLYIHLPFCESLCTFCACHKHITKRHEQELPYLKAVIAEWRMYIELLKATNAGKPIVRQLHLGGGTPTFFAPENLSFLLKEIYKDVQLAPDFEGSLEAHPENTTFEHLTILKDLGFKRLSIGVQDYNENIQKAIHRVQSFEQVEKVHEWALELGYESISQDLVYGLPFQNIEDLKNTLNKTMQLKPHRIAFYSYAHVPWIKGVGQRGFDENDLPSALNKLDMLIYARKTLIDQGYVDIGMDHFALPEDRLSLAIDQKLLHRNFMGYTVTNTQMMIGLGMSSISDTWFAFGQNEKNLKTYLEMIQQGNFPIVKAHILSERDTIIRKNILELMCHFTIKNFNQSMINPNQVNMFNELIKDEMMLIKNNNLVVTAKGKPFVRNIAMTIDPYLDKNNVTQFSKTI